MTKLSLTLPIMTLLGLIFGCSESSKPAADWTKSKKIAGKEQKLSHVSGVVVDDKFAYITTGGNLADQKEGLSGLRKVALDSGAVTILDDGKKLPQSEQGGIALDEKYVYWSGGGSIMRILKEGGTPETIATENVGMGIDMVIDDEKIYWANHSYYSPNTPAKPSPLYMVSKQGGKTETFTGLQQVPSDLVADSKFIYWHTVNAIFKQAKSGGETQIVYQATEKEGIDKLSQDAENLYFGFRSEGNSRWALRKIPKQGGEPQMLVKTFSLKPFVVDDTSIYFFDENGMTKDAFCKVSKDGGEVLKLDTGYSSGAITQSPTIVYFGALDDIYSFSK